MKKLFLIPLALLGLLFVAEPQAEARGIARGGALAAARPGHVAGNAGLRNLAFRARNAGLGFDRRNVGLFGGVRVNGRNLANFAYNNRAFYNAGYSNALTSFYQSCGYTPSSVSVSYQASAGYAAAAVDAAPAPCQPPVAAVYSQQTALLVPTYTYMSYLATPVYSTYNAFATVYRGYGGYGGHVGHVGHGRNFNFRRF